MDILEIQKYPAKILRAQSRPVDKVTQVEKKLFQRMLTTMRFFNGIGLAAPQVGILQRIIVADIGEGPLLLANPVIVQTRGTDVLKEGCLSLPDLGVKVVRSFAVRATGLNETGQFIEINAKGLLARVLQHEIDHLNGTLILDYLPFQERVKFDCGPWDREDAYL